MAQPRRGERGEETFPLGAEERTANRSPRSREEGRGANRDKQAAEPAPNERRGAFADAFRARVARQ